MLSFARLNPMTPAHIDQLEPLVHSALAQAPDEARRLFHGRGRCWPGLEQITVDWLQGVLLVSLFREPEAEALDALHQMLQRLARSPLWQQRQGQHLLLQHRYLPDSRTDFLFGEPIDQWQVSEQGLRYLLDFGRKQNSGLFLDMRLGRQWVQHNSQDARVLNLFAYTCAFSVAAIAGGAQHVVNLDMARAALSRGRDNHRLNGHALDQVSFLGHELFKSWGKVTKSGPYDLIIIDPPSFQKGSFVLTKDYQKILRRLPELLSPHGQVLACVNDPATGPEFLIDSMALEAPQLRFVERLDNPAEFADIHPDSGLKALLFKLD